jgi:hypothetical protein
LYWTSRSRLICNADKPLTLNRAVDTRRRAYRIYGVTVFGVLLRLSGDRQGIWGV